MQNLLEFLQKYHHWFLFVVLEVISLIMLFSYNSYHTVNEGRAEMESFFMLSKMNESLTKRNFYLERQLAQMRRLYSEATGDTSAFRQEMMFLKQFHLVPAKVVTNELNRSDNLLTINRGADDGVCGRRCRGRNGCCLWTGFGGSDLSGV